MAAEADGIFGKDIFFLVADNPEPPSEITEATNVQFDCCNAFTYKVYADSSGLEFNNDKKEFLFITSPLTSAAEISLQKFNTSSGQFESVATLANDDLGTFYDLNFFTNSKGEKYIGYLLDFALVLDSYGVGSYRVICVTTLATSATVTFTSDTYCLFNFIPDVVDGTVRIEYINNGIGGDEQNDEKSIEYPPDWYGQTRLPGFFAYVEDDGQEEFTRYTTGEDVWISSEKFPSYVFKSKELFWSAHQLLKTQISQADVCLLTDYNVMNFATFVKKKVKASLSYKPEFNFMRTKLAPVELKFKQVFNNFKKFRT